MKQPYLLGFVRNCNDLPSEPPLLPELMTVGEHSVIWCRSPKEIFTTKQDFLMAMLLWYEQIRHLQLTVLPIQYGVSVTSEVYLVKLLKTYQRELDLCFDKVEGTAEYCLTIQKSTDYAPLTYSALRKNVQSGKEYLERVRAYQQLRDREAQHARQVIDDLCARLAPWFKDYWAETPPNRGSEINLGFLVPNTCCQEFIGELDIILQELDIPDGWTGPWLPFHFSSLSLKSESFLIRESFNWGERRASL